LINSEKPVVPAQGKTMDGQVSAAIIAVVGTLGGSIIGWLSQRDGKTTARLERKVARYADEIRARQAEEDVACRWLVELNVAVSESAAKLKLRDRTEGERGRRPSVAPTDVTDM
jgi:hypothetical protein